MEPSIAEEAEIPFDDTTTKSSTVYGKKKQSPLRSRLVFLDVPSTKYPEKSAVDSTILRRAQSPPKPTLPRRGTSRTWNATAKERNPLTSGLTGPGRAGKYGELIAQSGGRYEGEVLAGRPHGVGKLFAPKGDGRGGYVLQYEGDWVQGTKEGNGTRYWHNGETYSGDFVSNVRHGRGRYFFENGDMYAGEWVDDKRTGHGTYYTVNGDVFTGNFNKDRKEGRGTLYMMSRQRKYVAEYVNGAPKCGTVLDIDDDDMEPLRGQLKNLALQKRLDLSATGQPESHLPPLELLQPNKMLAVEVVAVRKGRTEGKRDLKAVQAASGTLTDKEIEMLRHSYTLMAGGDDIKVGLLPHQLRELCVMAGLDPASEATRQLVELLLVRRNEKTGRIHFDVFMQVVIHFQEADAQGDVDDDGQAEEEGEEEQYYGDEGEGEEGAYEEGGGIYDDDGMDAGMPSVAEDPVEYADAGEQQAGEYGEAEGGD